MKVQEDTIVVTVTVVLTGSKVGPSGPKRVKVPQGGRLRLESPHGKVTFNFPSPLKEGPPLLGNTKHPVNGPLGVYIYQCGITTPDGEEFGWPKNPESSDGGEVEVINRGA